MFRLPHQWWLAIWVILLWWPTAAVLWLAFAWLYYLLRGPRFTIKERR